MIPLSAQVPTRLAARSGISPRAAIRSMPRRSRRNVFPETAASSAASSIVIHRTKIVLEILPPQQPRHGCGALSGSGGCSSLLTACHTGTVFHANCKRRSEGWKLNLSSAHAVGSMALKCLALERHGVGRVEHLRQRPIESRDLRQNGLLGRRAGTRPENPRARRRTSGSSGARRGAPR